MHYVGLSFNSSPMIPMTIYNHNNQHSMRVYQVPETVKNASHVSTKKVFKMPPTAGAATSESQHLGTQPGPLMQVAWTKPLEATPAHVHQHEAGLEEKQQGFKNLQQHTDSCAKTMSPLKSLNTRFYNIKVLFSFFLQIRKLTHRKVKNFVRANTVVEG